MMPNVTCACGTAYEPKSYLWCDVLTTFDNGLCPACDQKRVDDSKAADAARERAHRAKHWWALDMPFPDTDRARLPASRADFVLKWRPNPQFASGLVISGETGLGKTRTVIELLKDIYIETGHPFEFCRVTEWRLRLDKAHRYGGKGVADLVRPLCRTPLLVMDDFGHGKWTENSLASVFEILDARTSKGLPSILTTQKTKDQLSAQFSVVNADTSAAIIRRMSEFMRLVLFVKKEACAAAELALS